MKTIRVFPRKTKASPDDNNVRFSYPCLFDEADKILVSVTFKEDLRKAEELLTQWKYVTNDIEIGGPALGDRGGEFEPGMYLKKGYTVTSRGCPNNCWFCLTPEREGNIRELGIKEGFNVIDSNLLACSDDHIKKVFAMLGRQKKRAMFTGGFDATRIKSWVVEELKKLNPVSVFFAYDTPDDYEPLVNAVKLLKEAEIPLQHNYRCYVLCGYKNDTLDKAEKRMKQAMSLGLMPMAMLFDKEKHLVQNDGWVKYQREWANPIIVGYKMRHENTKS